MLNFNLLRGGRVEFLMLVNVSVSLIGVLTYWRFPQPVQRLMHVRLHIPRLSATDISYSRSPRFYYSDHFIWLGCRGDGGWGRWHDVTPWRCGSDASPERRPSCIRWRRPRRTQFHQCRHGRRLDAGMLNSWLTQPPHLDHWRTRHRDKKLLQISLSFLRFIRFYPFIPPYRRSTDAVLMLRLDDICILLTWKSHQQSCRVYIRAFLLHHDAVCILLSLSSLNTCTQVSHINILS